MTSLEHKKRFGIEDSADLAKAFLAEYKFQTDSIYDKYSKGKMKIAKEFGPDVLIPMEQFYVLGGEGKRLRGALVVLGYLLGGGQDVDEVTKTSIFIELLQTGALVHDDIMDMDEKRRGHTTIHKYMEDHKQSEPFPDRTHYGNSIAICVGDVAFFKSVQLLAQAKLPADRVVAAVEMFSNSSQLLVYGQMMDVSNGIHSGHTKDDILKIMKYKTSEYTILLPLLIGFNLAKKIDKKSEKLIRELADALGWAFQIQDDVLGTFGTEKMLGKPVDSDIKSGKQTLLIMHLREHATAKQQKLLKRVHGNPEATVEELQQLRDALIDAGSYDHIINMGWENVRKGVDIIDLLTSDPEVAPVLKSLTVLMMDRVK